MEGRELSLWCFVILCFVSFKNIRESHHWNNIFPSEIKFCSIGIGWLNQDQVNEYDNVLSLRSSSVNVGIWKLCGWNDRIYFRPVKTVLTMVVALRKISFELFIHVGRFLNFFRMRVLSSPSHRLLAETHTNWKTERFARKRSAKTSTSIWPCYYIKHENGQIMNHWQRVNDLSKAKESVNLDDDSAPRCD